MNMEPANNYEFHHQRVTNGIKSFYDVADSLATIRDKKLFLEAGYKNFSEYCEV